ncbi:MAG: hypothetical protein GX781_10075, partial [Clostridiales bacterium]|nr:hypothetical protein [Clostridiales bacterium]
MPKNTLDTVPIGINRKRRPGLARVITHIILFAIIGIIALSFGVYGLKKLELKTIDQKAIVRIETLFESSIKEMQSRVKDIDKEHASDIKIGIDSRKRKLKESITAMVRQGEENHAIAMMAMSTLEEGILNRIKDEKIRQNITETITLENSSISEEIEELVTIAVERMNPAQTRLALMVTEP